VGGYGIGPHFTPITNDVYPDATLAMTDLAVGPLGVTSGGTIEFFDNGGSLILRIDFDSAVLYDPFGFGASQLAGNDVVFSGPIITYPLVEQAFAFSFANQVNLPNGYTWTAAFTSSAIPEPATAALLGLAGVALAIGRRRL